MPATEVCATEDFVAEATPQSGSLEEAASTQEILIQQVEGYLNRMREAMCNDLTSLQVQLDACNCEPNGGAGLPDLVDQVEVSSDREVNGFPTFFKLIVVPTLANNGTVTVAHNIVPVLPFVGFFTVSATLIVNDAIVPTFSTPITFSGNVSLADTMSWFIDAADVVVTTGSNRTNYTNNFAILEYYYR